MEFNLIVLKKYLEMFKFIKERKRINTYLKSQSVYQQMIFVNLFKFWMDSLLELYDLYRLGIKPTSKTIDVIKQIKWKIIDDLKEMKLIR